ncbi:hypothetical protein KBC79_00050 [Candidatus Woesebacteria bacterium]|nr:hypothetical protein [Candidatus Woesebacteria bacterium]
MSHTLFRAVAEEPIIIPKPLPVGSYIAKLISYDFDQLPPWVNFVFEVRSGKFIGKRAGYTVKPELVVPAQQDHEPTLFSISSSLLGKNISIGDFIDLNDLVGLSCRITITDPRMKGDVTALSATAPLK